MIPPPLGLFRVKKIVLGSLQILNWFNFIFSLFQQLSAQRLPQMLAWIMPMGKQFAIMEIVLVSSFSLVEREITWKWFTKANCIQWYKSMILNRSSAHKKTWSKLNGNHLKVFSMFIYKRVFLSVWKSIQHAVISVNRYHNVVVYLNIDFAHTICYIQQIAVEEQIN